LATEKARAEAISQLMKSRKNNGCEDKQN